jgi:dihydrodipicolinate synthase/N-acetylneuraminate lyase
MSLRSNSRCGANSSAASTACSCSAPSEGQYVTAEERALVIATAVRVACGVPVVVGIHTCDFDTARQQLLQAKELGAAAVLVKYLGNPRASFGEVCGFYAALSDLNALPIIYYHYPAQTGLKLSVAQVCQLLSLPGVIGIKESILDLGEVRRHLHHCRGLHKVFLCSTALQLTQFLDLGGQGAMCPEAVLLPCPVVHAYEAYVHGEHGEARAIQKQLYELSPILRTRAKGPGLTRLMFMTAADLKLPVPMSQGQTQAKVKCALNGLGVPTPTAVKCPLPPLTVRDWQAVQGAVRRLSAIVWADVSMRVPPVPRYAEAQPRPGGGLLKTGAFMLGPGVQQDLLRSQGDGLYGFPRW